MSGVAGTEKAFAEFTKATGIEVEAIVVNSWILWEEKAALMIATGQQLDLLRCDTGRAAQAALRGWLIPLSPLVALDNIDL
ncbi:MAG TPA: extracellular solute-binding protein, partial [Firmicutes bacterium]|nr:extracellular solute-binding protein [Bacillota bacterium]